MVVGKAERLSEIELMLTTSQIYDKWFSWMATEIPGYLLRSLSLEVHLLANLLIIYPMVYHRRSMEDGILGLFHSLLIA